MRGLAEEKTFIRKGFSVKKIHLENFLRPPDGRPLSGLGGHVSHFEVALYFDGSDKLPVCKMSRSSAVMSKRNAAHDLGDKVFYYDTY